MAISLPKVCSMGGSQTGLVGTIGVALLNPDGTVHTARATAGIYEVGGGCYGKNISFPDNWIGIIKWDTGGGSPVYAVEEYTVDGLVDAATEDLDDIKGTGFVKDTDSLVDIRPETDKIQTGIIDVPGNFKADVSNLDAAVSTRSSHTAADAADAVWDEILTGASHNIATSAGRRLRQAADALIIREETCQAGGANNEVILDAGASAIDDFYLYDIVILESGTGAGQSRHIDSYIGGSRTAKVNRDWTTNPDGTTNYVLRFDSTKHVHGLEPTARQHVRDAMKLAPAAGVPTAGSVDKHLDDIEADVTGLNGDAMRGTDGAYTGTPPTVDQIATAIFDKAVEGTLTLVQLQRIIRAFIGGKSSGGGTTGIKFRDGADAKDRIAMTVDDNGNRSVVTLDGT